MNVCPDKEIEIGNFAPRRLALRPVGSICVVDWNINRGLQLNGVLDFLTSVKADLVLLQESDLNARRTHRLNIAQEIAQKLEMNYVFGREFQELTQGSNDSPAYHGQVTLSRWPLSNPRIIRFKRQSTFWHPRWFLPDIEPLQERIGGRMALITEMAVPGRMLVSYNLHLESRGDDKLRCSQLEECVVDSLGYKPNVPIVLAGDLNMDASGTCADRILRQASFRNTFSRRPDGRTSPHSLFGRKRTIDWVFSRGLIKASSAHVHSSARASDHFPLSVQLIFT